MGQPVSREQQTSGWITNSIRQGRLDDSFWNAAKRENPGGDASIQTMLRQLKGELPLDVREALPGAVALSVASWDRKRDGLYALQNLAWFASDLRASRAVGDLQHHTEKLIPGYRNPRVFDTLRATVLVVAGFAPEIPQARSAVENWLDRPELIRFTGSLVNILCHCSPHEYPKYLARIFKVADEHPDYFEEDTVLKETVRQTSIPIVAQELYRLSESDLPRFLKAITSEPFPAARLAVKPPTLHSIREKKAYVCKTPAVDDINRLNMTFQAFVVAA